MERSSALSRANKTQGTFSYSFSFDLTTQFVVGLVALGASIFVTLAYHARYPEFRGGRVKWEAIGIGMGTIGYLLTGNPIAPVASHEAMHAVAVYHGPEGTVHLPPHYDDPSAPLGVKE